jgi:hypothetical protein
MSLKIVKKLKPCTFKWKLYDEKIHLGFIAQDVEKIYPKDKFDIVHEVDGMLQIRYAEFIPVLTKAIQELEEKIKLLEEKFNYKMLERAKLLEEKCQ